MSLNSLIKIFIVSTFTLLSTSVLPQESSSDEENVNSQNSQQAQDQRPAYPHNRGQGPRRSRGGEFGGPSIARLDTDGDGLISEEEFTASRPEREPVNRDQLRNCISTQAPEWDNQTRLTREIMFSRIDEDEDGYISESEIETARARQRAQRQAVRECLQNQQ